MALPVYKFMSGEDYHLDALRDNQVYFSSVEQLNDPYEGLMHYCTKNVTHSQRMAALTQRLKPDHLKIADARKEAESFYKRHGEKLFNARMDRLCREEYKDFLEYHRAHRFVLSLSKPSSPTDSFPSPLNSMMMWAHYGKGMQGLCVEYDFNTLRESINLLNKVEITTQEVEYEPLKLPIVRATTLLDDLAMNTNQTSIEIHNAFCTKHVSWRYENEVRLISSKHEHNNISDKAILRVFVSAKSPDLMSDVIRILKGKEHKPELYEVITQENEYGFGFGKVEY